MNTIHGRWRALTGLLLAALLAFGCTPDGNGGDGGGGSGGGGGGNDGGVPQPDIDTEALAADLAEYYCELVRTCWATSADLAIIRQLIEAGGDCESWFAGNLSGLADGLTSGDAELNEAAFDQCVRASIDSCVTIDAIAQCREVVTGRRMAGEACPDGDFCAPGLFCDYDGGPGAEGECNDVCAPQRAPGEVCQDDDECAGEGERLGFCHYADPFDDAGTCTRLGIGPRAGAGQPCGLLPDGDDFDRVVCADGHYCAEGDDDEVGVCRPVVALGQPCGGPDVVCDGGICISGTCTALEIGSRAGAPCNPRLFQLCNPLSRLVCVDDTCVASEGGAGEACADDEFSVRCQDGLYCDEGTCRAQTANGEACDGEDGYLTCLSNYCDVGDDGQSGVCADNPFFENTCE